MRSGFVFEKGVPIAGLPLTSLLGEPFHVLLFFRFTLSVAGIGTIISVRPRGTLQTSIHEHAAYILRPLASVSLSLLPSIILPFPLWSTRVLWTLLLSLCIGTNEKHMHANCRATLHSPLSSLLFCILNAERHRLYYFQFPFYFTDAFPKFLFDLRSFPPDDHGPLFSCPSAKSFMQNAIDGFSIHWGIRSSR